MWKIPARLCIFLLYVSIILGVLYWAKIIDVHLPWNPNTFVSPSRTPTATVPDEPQSGAVWEAIFSGAVLIRSFRQDFREIDRLQGALDHARKLGDEEMIKLNEEALENTRGRMRITFDLYVAQLQSTKQFSETQISQQLNALEGEFGKREGMQPFVDFARLYVSHSNAYRQDGVIDRHKILEQIAPQ